MYFNFPNGMNRNDNIEQRRPCGYPGNNGFPGNGGCHGDYGFPGSGRYPATAQPRQITDAQVTAGFQAAIQAAIFQAGSRAAARDPEDHRGQPDQQALRVQWDPEDAPEHRALPDQLVPWGLRAM